MHLHIFLLRVNNGIFSGRDFGPYRIHVGSGLYHLMCELSGN